MKDVKAPPIVCIAGLSGSGKTTLIERLIPELIERGLKVGTVKHNPHEFEMDKPGKDSRRHKKAGASATIISSPDKIGMVMDVDHDLKPEELVPFLSDMDIILAEGYKRSNNDKIEVIRSGAEGNLLLKDDENLLAVVTDSELDLDVLRFSTADIKGLADFLGLYFNLLP